MWYIYVFICMSNTKYTSTSLDTICSGLILQLLRCLCAICFENRDQFSTCLFTLQMAAIGRIRPGWNQKPRASPSSFTQIAGTQTSRQFPTAFVGASAGNRIQSRAPRTWTRAYRECWHYRPFINLIYYNVGPINL